MPFDGLRLDVRRCKGNIKALKTFEVGAAVQADPMGNLENSTYRLRYRDGETEKKRTPTRDDRVRSKEWGRMGEEHDKSRKKIGIWNQLKIRPELAQNLLSLELAA